MCVNITTKMNSSKFVTILSNHLFEIEAIHKNKMKKITIPQGTQLVEKGCDDMGNKIFMFHIYENGKLITYTSTKIPINMLHLFENNL